MSIFYALLDVAHVALSLYMWVLIASIIMSWLTAFGVVNSYQPLVRSVSHFLYALTEPALRPIRRHLPAISGVDLSPMILALVIYFLQSLIANIYLRGF